MKHLYFILSVLLFTFENLSAAQVEVADIHNIPTLSTPSISDDENPAPTGSPDKFRTPVGRRVAELPLASIPGQIGRNNSHINYAEETIHSAAASQHSDSSKVSRVSVEPEAPIAAMPAPVVAAAPAVNEDEDDDNLLIASAN